MKSIVTLPNQTLFDVAIANYGTLDGVIKLLDDNADIQFDTSQFNLGLTVREHNVPRGSTDIAMPLIAGQTLTIDEQWAGRNIAVLKALNTYQPVTAQ